MNKIKTLKYLSQNAILYLSFFIGLGNLTAQGNIVDNVEFEYHCNYYDVIKSSDQFHWEISSFASGGESVAHNYYRRIDALFYEVSSGNLVKEVNLTEHYHGVTLLPSVQLMGGYDATIDEETLMGLPHGQIKMNLRFTYSRDSSPQSIAPFVEAHLTDQPQYNIMLYASDVVTLYPIEEVLCFDYYVCPEVTVVSGGLGPSNSNLVHAVLNEPMSDPIYEWEIDGVPQNINEDHVIKQCGAHNYAVTVTDTKTGCQTIDDANIFRPCPVIEWETECTAPAFNITTRKDSLGNTLVVLPPNRHPSLIFHLVIVNNRPGCCPESNANITVETIVITDDTAILPAEGCYSYAIYSFCRDNPLESYTAGPFCSTASIDQEDDTIDSRINEGPQDQELLIQVFPNPTNDFVNLKLNQELEDLSFEIIDIRGQQVIKGSLPDRAKTFRVNVENLSAGSYFLRIQNEKQIIGTQRILIIN